TGHRVATVQSHPAELADVAEADLAPVRQLEHEPDIRIERGVRGHGGQLFRHLEVDGERGLTRQVDDQLLATPAHRLDAPSSDGLGERLWRTREAGSRP